MNLFDGGPRSEVSFWIDDGEPRPMRHVVREDPHVLEVLARNEDTKKSWVQAVPSSHLFAADLPDELGPGSYVLTVRAEDEFGAVHHGHAVLEITG